MSAHLPYWDGTSSKKIRGRILYFQHPDGSNVTLILSRGKYWMIPKDIQQEAFFLELPDEGRFIELEKTTAGFRWHELAKTMKSKRPRSE